MRTDWLRVAPLLLLLTAADVQAQVWLREYDRGLRAVQQSDWAEAEARFAAAMRDDPAPQERRRFQGVVSRPYVPHYYAGLAAFRQGNCERALQYWTHADTDAVLARLPDLRGEQQSGLSTCRTRLAQAAPTRPQPDAPATTSPAASTPATAQTTPAATRPAATAPAQQTVASQPATRPPATTQTPPGTTQTRPPTTPAASSPATAGSAPAVLRSAVEGFLAGRYQDLLRIDASTGPDQRAKAQLHLLRAAAGYTLAQQQPEATGAATLESARRDIRAARAAQANLNPDPVLFSPKFRNFWQQTR